MRKIIGILVCTTALAGALVSRLSAAQNTDIVGTPQIVAAFNAAQIETPESVAIDYAGNRFVSLNLTGEIRKIAPDGTQSTHAWLPLGAPPLSNCGGPFPPIMGSLAVDHQGALFIGVAGCGADQHAVYRIDPDGTVTRIAQLPATALPNGIALRGEFLYVADSGLQIVWRIPTSGGAADVWADDPLLKKDPNAPPLYPGPNGLQFYLDEVYVAVSGGFRVVAIKMNSDGSAGAIRVHHAGTGCDDFAFDVLGNMYCGTDPFNTLVKIRPDGSSTVLLTAADGLDGPTSVTFGRRAGEALDLYITNGSFPIFPPPSGVHTPTLMKVRLSIPGLPRP